MYIITLGFNRLISGQGENPASLTRYLLSIGYVCVVNARGSIYSDRFIDINLSGDEDNVGGQHKDRRL